MKKSRASLTIDLIGPSVQVEQAVETVTHALRQFSGVTVSFPSPLRISEIRRERRSKPPVPEAGQP